MKSRSPIILRKSRRLLSTRGFPSRRRLNNTLRGRIDIADDRTVKVDMSLTSPNCPSAQELPVMVQNAVSTVPGVGKVDVSVVWDPPWEPSRMSEEARVVLNML